MQIGGLFDTNTMPWEAIDQATKRKLMLGEKMMAQLIEISAGSISHPSHSHPHEQIMWVVSGEMKFELDGAPEQRCPAGSLVIIPGGKPHRTWFDTDTTLIEIFAPIRTDLLPA